MDSPKSQQTLKRRAPLDPSDAAQIPGFAASDMSTNLSHKPDAQLKKVFSIVFVVLLIDLLAFTCILPLFPALLDYYGKNDQDITYSTLQNAVTSFQNFLGIPPSHKFNTVLYGGLLGSMFSFLQFVASPLVGALSDYYGRKSMMIVTTVGIALSYVIWAMSYSFTLFVIARFVGGLSKGNISLGTAIVTDVSTPQTRGKGMALVGIAFSVGFILGPMIGAFFSSYARTNATTDFFVYPAIFALTLEVIDLVMIWLWLPETLPKEKRAKSVTKNLKESVYLIDPRHLVNFTAVKDLDNKERASLRKIGLAYFLFLFFFSGLEFTLTFLTHSRFGYDSVHQGKMFFFIGIIMILVQGGYIRRMGVGKEMRVATLAFLIVIPAFVIIAFAKTQMMLYFGLILYSMGSSAVVPCLSTRVSQFGRDDQKGTVMGIFRSLGALARAFGPLLASALYWGLGPAIAYCIGGALLLVPLYIISDKSKKV